MVNAINVEILPVVLCGANEKSKFTLGEGSRSSMLFLVEVKYRAELSLKMTIIG